MNCVPQPLRLTPDLYQFEGITLGNPQTPWLLFLHGFLGDCWDFVPMMADLSKDFYCISLDLPGHGQTFVVEDSPNCPHHLSESPYTLPATAAGILQGLDQCFERLEIHPSHPVGLVGYSMGGRLALYLHLTTPQRWRGSVIESASPGLASESEGQQRLHQDNQRAAHLESLTSQTFPAFLEQWYQQSLFYPIREDPHYPEMLRRRCKGNPYTLAQSLRHMSLGAQPSLWEALPTSTVPLCFVVGAEDTKFVTLNQTMTRCCPQATLKIISQAGHNCHLSHPETFADIVRSFFP